MGKSTVSQQFQRLGCPVFCADSCVHRLYSKGGDAVEPIRAAFPSAVIDDVVNRDVLSRCVLGNSDALCVLEGIVHPLVAKERNRFLADATHRHCLAVIYDIPLLLENKDKHAHIDEIVVVTAHEDIQRRRVLARKGMTIEKFELILQRQVPDAEKRQLADYLIHTDAESFTPAKGQVARVLEQIIGKYPSKWAHFKDHGRRSYQHRIPVVASSDVVASAGTDSNISTMSPFTLRDHIDLVLFDLDDTLIAMMPCVIGASRAMSDTLRTLGMPRTADAIDAGKNLIISKRLPYVCMYMLIMLLSFNHTNTKTNNLHLIASSVLSLLLLLLLLLSFVLDWPLLNLTYHMIILSYDDEL